MSESIVKPEILNLAFYRFFEFDSYVERREPLKELATRLGLKGTVLLSPEGINCFIAGTPAAVREAQQWLEAIEGFGPPLNEVDIKESWTTYQPFPKFRARLKSEIISMRTPSVKPALRTGPRVKPVELKKWLSGEEKVILIDTRNDFEIAWGTFEGAEVLNLRTFGQFPERLKARAAEQAETWKDSKVVMFCTGGIRCEKATALALDLGLENVYQLDGGILKYFEEVGQDHYRGDCFVFDARLAVDSKLNPTRDTAGKPTENPPLAAGQSDDSDDEMTG